MKTSTHLMLSSVMVVIVMCCMMNFAIQIFGLRNGVLFSMLFYWFGLCFPLAYYFQGRRCLRLSISFSLQGKTHIAWSVLIAVVFVGVYTILTLPDDVPWQVFLLAPIFGVINGTAEEVYWRGTYLKLAKRRAPVWFFGLICFTAWHFAFIISGGMVFAGGPAALILGAFGAGVFWMWIVWQTNRIGWTIISHILFSNNWLKPPAFSWSALALFT